MINEAIEKIERASESCDDTMTKMLSRQIIDNITSNIIAERILVENKTLTGCKKTFDDYASKNKKGNQSIIDPQKAEELIFEYFEIKTEEMKPNAIGVINILDFVK